jgi:carboxypeptidase C (cathepsin A)
MKRKPIALIIAILFAANLAADEPAKPKDPPAPKDLSSQTRHSITIDDKKIDYVATAGTMVLKEEDGKPRASIFYIAYAKVNADLFKRPITFCFNGGPGSSSVWLHMGAFGPQRVVYTDDGQPLPPPAKLIETNCTALPSSG